MGELKHNILQCLEDEVDNLEQEMRALDTQEQMIIEEEMEDLMSDEKDDANEDSHKVQLQEIHEEIVERKKHAADKKRKVLERFQHVLDANDSKGRRRRRNRLVSRLWRRRRKWQKSRQLRKNFLNWSGRRMRQRRKRKPAKRRRKPRRNAPTAKAGRGGGTDSYQGSG